MSTEPIDIDALVEDLQDALADRQKNMKGGGALYSRAIFGLVYLSHELTRARECIEKVRTLVDNPKDAHYPILIRGDVHDILADYDKGII